MSLSIIIFYMFAVFFYYLIFLLLILTPKYLSIIFLPFRGPKQKTEYESNMKIIIHSSFIIKY